MRSAGQAAYKTHTTRAAKYKAAVNTETEGLDHNRVNIKGERCPA